MPELFVYSPEMITVELLKMSFSIIKYYVCLNNSRIMAYYSHVINACYRNMPQNLFTSCSFVTTNIAEKLYTS